MTVETLQKGVQRLKDFLKTVPEKPGVYRMLNQEKEVLYVGKAKNLKKRVMSYTQVERLPLRLKRMVSQCHDLKVFTTHTELEALLLESNLIKQLKPSFNILLRDDKMFPCIGLSQDHSFSRLFYFRGKVPPSTKVYGPFASAEAVGETITTLHRVFHLRSCTNPFFASRRRPCLQYHIKRCSAPCVGKISQEDYGASVKQAKSFLEGRTHELQKYWQEKMEKASDEMDYEKAASYRDRIKLLTRLQSQQRINWIPGVKDVDVLAVFCMGKEACVQVSFFRNSYHYGTEGFFLTRGEEEGEVLEAFVKQFYDRHSPPPLLLLSHPISEIELIKESFRERYGSAVTFQVPRHGAKRDIVDQTLTNARLSLERRIGEKATFHDVFQEVQRLFHLPKVPKRLEAYDNSHLQGSAPYGVMVVATPEGFDKKSYRLFQIQDLKETRDDYAMMRQVLRRRFNHAGSDGWAWPELILIDGGKGHLKVATEVLKEANIDTVSVVAMGKGAERKVGDEFFFQEGHCPFQLPSSSFLAYFLQRFRDEAHRFALGSHRRKSKKNLLVSRLDGVPGIGPKRKKSLLRHFGSSQAVAQAGVGDLEKVPGISPLLAKSIYSYFHN